MPDEDLDAGFDAETLVRAREIEKDAGRMQRAKDFAGRQQDHFKQLAESIPGKPKRAFNGTVKNSRMNG